MFLQVEEMIYFQGQISRSLASMQANGGMAWYMNPGEGDRVSFMSLIGQDPPNVGKKISIASVKNIRAWYPNEYRRIENYTHECAIRFSKTLYMTGTNIASMRKFPVSPLGFMRMASHAALWLNENYGPPMAGSAKSRYGNISVLTVQEFDKIASKASGIVYFEYSFGMSGSGHIDYWTDFEMGTIKAKGVFYDAYNYNRPPDLVIWYWPLK